MKNLKFIITITLFLAIASSSMGQIPVRNGEKVSQNREALLGSWEGCDGRVVTIERHQDEYRGYYTTLGGLGKYGFRVNEIGYKLKYDASGKYVGEVKWRSTSGDISWHPCTIRVEDNIYYDNGADSCSKKMIRKNSNELTPDQKPITQEIGNIRGVTNKPRKPTIFQFDTPVKLLYLRTYHWNFGKGKFPGSIGLRHNDGTLYGLWQTRGLDGQGGVQNAYWAVNPNVPLKPGVYTVVDSNPETWSTNEMADWIGFAEIRTEPIAIIKDENGDGVSDKEKAELADRIRKIREEAEKAERDTRNGEKMSQNREALLGSWEGCDGRVVTIERHQDEYRGYYTTLGGLGKYGFRVNEIGYKLKYDASGKYVGEVKWRSTKGDISWHPCTIRVEDNIYYDNGADSCSKKMIRKNSNELTPDQKPITQEIGNIRGVTNKPRKPTIFQFDTPVKLLYLRTYHWNFGKGKFPGSIGLRHNDGTLYGLWQTRGLDGQGGVQNAYWAVNPNVPLKPGVYTVVDSNPETWSTNEMADWIGFAEIRTEPITIIKDENGDGVSDKEKAELADRIRKIREEAEKAERDTRNGEKMSQNREALLGSWEGCDGRVVTIERHQDEYRGYYTTLGGLGKYGFRVNEIGYKLKYDASGKYVGEVKWRSTSGDISWHPCTIRVEDNIYYDNGADSCSKKMIRK